MVFVLEKPILRESRPNALIIRSAVAVAAAFLAVFCLLYGLSFPGFPMWAAGWGLMAAATSVILVAVSGIRSVATGRSRGNSALMVVLITLLLAAGAAVAKQDDGARLADRWAASQTAFENEVATAGTPVPLESPPDSGYFAAYPGSCPARMGTVRIIECRAIDGGYLFLQAQGAITDDSGIVYLPADAESQWRMTERMSPLGGPWWSWTCHC